MPQAITDSEAAPLVVLAPNLVAGVEVRGIDEVRGQPLFCICADSRLERPEVLCKREVLLLIQILIRENQHAITPERVLDRGNVLGVELREIDANLGREIFGNRVDADRHKMTLIAVK